MQINAKPITVALILVAAMFSLQATAQTNGLFVEGTYGLGKAITNTAGYGSTDMKDSNWALKAGYMFNQSFGVEAGYRDLGDFSGTGALTPSTVVVPMSHSKTPITITSTGAFGVRTQVDGLLLGGRFNMPVSTNVVAQLRGGLFRWKSKSDVSATNSLTVSRSSTLASSTVVAGGTDTISEEGTDFYWGMGGQYRFSSQVGVGLGFSQYRVGHDRHNGIDVTMVYNF